MMASRMSALRLNLERFSSSEVEEECSFCASPGSCGGVSIIAVVIGLERLAVGIWLGGGFL